MAVYEYKGILIATGKPVKDVRDAENAKALRTSLRKDGILLYEEDLVKPEGLPPTVKAFGVPATRIAEELGRKMVLNIVMVGFFTAVTGVVGEEAMREAVKDSVPPSTIDLNMKAFERGFAYGKKLVAQGVAEIALGAHAHECRDAVIREPLQMIGQVLARVVLDPEACAAAVPEVAVGVDNRGHHRLAGETHPCGAFRRPHVAGAPHLGETAVLHDERRVLDWRALVADDKPRSFEEDGVRFGDRGRRGAPGENQ